MMGTKFIPRITVFHCVNTFADTEDLSIAMQTGLKLKSVKMACSSMVKDVYLLRAFESGSDAVIVMVCPEDQCRYIEGSIRAKKRVNWVRNLLDEIGLGSGRLTLHNISAGDTKTAAQIVRQVMTDLEASGPSPAK